MWLIGGDGGSGDNDVMYPKLYYIILLYLCFSIFRILKNTIHTAEVNNVECFHNVQHFKF